MYPIIDPTLFLTPEERKRMNVRTAMMAVNIISIPPRVVGEIVGIGIGLIAKTHPNAEKAIQYIGEKIQSIVPDSLKEKYTTIRARIVDKFLKDYQIPPEETEYFLDSVSEIVQTGLTIGVGSLAKGAGKGLLRVTQKIHVTSMEKLKYAKAASKGKEVFKVRLEKGGTIDLELYYGKKQHLTAYVKMLRSDHPFQPQGVAKQALEAIEKIAIETGAKKLNIEFIAANEKLLKIMNKRYEKLFTSSASGYPSAEIFKVPLTSATHATAPIQLFTPKDILPLSVIGMSIGGVANYPTLNDNFNIEYKDRSKTWLDFQAPSSLPITPAFLSESYSSGSSIQLASAHVTPPFAESPPLTARSVKPIPTNDCAFVPAPSDPSQPPADSSLLLACAEAITPLMNEIAENLKEGQNEIDPEAIKKENKQIEQLSNETKKVENAIKGVKAAHIIMQSIIDCWRGNEADRERLAQAKAVDKHFQNEHQRLSAFLDRLSIGTASHEMLSHYHSPQDYFTNLHSIVDDYKKDLRELNEKLAHIQSQKQNLEGKRIEVASLDHETGEFFRKLIKKKQQMGAKFRVLSTVVKAVGAGVSLIPGMQPVGMGIAAAGSIGGQVAEQETNDGIAKLSSERQQLGTKNLETAQKLAGLTSEYFNEENQAKREVEQLRQFNREEGHNFLPPREHQNELKKDIAASGKEKQEIENQKKELEGEKAKEEKKLKENQKQLGKIKRKNKKAKVAKQAEIKSREAHIEQMKKDLQTLEDKQKEKEIEVKKGERALRKAEYFGSLRQIEHNILNKMNPSAKETEEEREHREKVEGAIFQHFKNSSLFDASWQQWDSMARDLLLTGGSATKAIGSMLGMKETERVDRAVSFSLNIWELSKSIIKAKDVYYPGMKTFFKEHYKDAMTLYLAGKLSSPAGAAFVGLFLYQVVIPLLQGITLAHNSWSSIKQETRESMEEKLNRLSKAVIELQKTENSIQESVQKLNADLTLVSHQLLTEVEEGFKAMRELMNLKAYEKEIELVDQKAISIEAKTNKLKTLIKKPEPSKSERIGQLREFLTFIDGCLLYTHESLFSGFKKGHSVTQDGQKIYPKVNVSLIYRNPEYFTSLLANSLGVYKKGVPNGYLLEKTLESLIGYIQGLRSLPLEQAASMSQILQETKDVKQPLLDICQKIRRSVAEIESLFELLPNVIDRLIESRNKAWYEIYFHTQKSRQLKEKFMQADRKRALKYFEPHLLRALTEDFVGSQKFFLYQEFREKPFLEQLETLNFQKIHDEKIYRSETLAKARKVGEFTFVMGITGIFTFGLVPAVAGLILLAKRISRPLDLDDIDLDLQYPNQKLRKLQEKVEQHRQLSLHALRIQKPAEVNFSSKVEVQYRQDAFYFDVRKRKIERIMQNSSSEAEAHLLVDIDTGVRWDDNNTIRIASPKIDIQFQEKSPIQVKDLDQIPAPSVDSLNYDNSVRMLMYRYYNLLYALLLGKPFMEENPFQAIKDSCQIIPGIRDELVPLALPKELIEECEKRLNPGLHLLEATDSGTLIPYYDFSLKEGTLSLCFRFISEDNLKGQNFSRITIAKFDKRTLRIFQKDLENPHSVAVTEFLIQAVYTSFGKGLGMAGQGTYETKSHLIAPQETGFAGLYRLWEFAPECRLEYNSADYSECLHQNLTNAMKGDEDLLPKTDRIFQPLTVQIEEDYLSVLLKSRPKHHAITAIEKEFTERFSLFLAFVKLLSNVENQTLYAMINNYFGIVPKILNEEFIQPSLDLSDEISSKEVTEEMKALFVWEIQHKPSKKLTKLRQQVEELTVIENFVNSSSLRGVAVTQPKLSVPPSSTFCPLIGLPNLTNSCYINASLQVLLASQFKRSLENLSSEKLSNPVVRHVKNLFDFMEKKHDSGIRESLLALRATLFDESLNPDPDFSEGLTDQNDAGVFLSTILSNFGYQLFTVERRSGRGYSINEASQKEIAISTQDVQNILHIPIGKGSSKFVDLIDRYFNETAGEKEGVWEQEEQGTRYRIPESTIVRRLKGPLPNILFFQLKRYESNPDFKKEQPASAFNPPFLKVNRPVEMAEEGIIDISKYVEEPNQGKKMYRLIGCVDHCEGGFQHGHYTAFVQKENRWFYANDDLILCEVSFDEVKKAQHYIYVFEKENQ